MINESKILSEVYYTLAALGDGFIDALPPHVYYFIKDNRDVSYVPRIDKNLPFEEQNISDEALSVICELHLRYFVESEKERKQIQTLLDFNEKKASEDLISRMFK